MQQESATQQRLLAKALAEARSAVQADTPEAYARAIEAMQLAVARTRGQQLRLELEVKMEEYRNRGEHLKLQQLQQLEEESLLGINEHQMT